MLQRFHREGFTHRHSWSMTCNWICIANMYARRRSPSLNQLTQDVLLYVGSCVCQVECELHQNITATATAIHRHEMNSERTANATVIPHQCDWKWARTKQESTWTKKTSQRTRRKQNKQNNETAATATAAATTNDEEKSGAHYTEKYEAHHSIKVEISSSGSGNSPSTTQQ